MDKKKILEQVKKLRDETGIGVMACKKALEETNGNYEEAKKLAMKKGIKKAEEKQERETKSGFVVTYTHATGTSGVIAKILCETDFVAKNSDFRDFCKEICLQIVSMDPKKVSDLLKQDYIRDPSKTIEQLLKESIAKFGENIQIEKFERLAI